MKETRDTVYTWLQRARDAKQWMDDYDRWGVSPTYQHYQEQQAKYDEAMQQIEWMKRLAPFEAKGSEETK
jgi:hypothetical protein